LTARLLTAAQEKIIPFGGIIAFASLLMSLIMSAMKVCDAASNITFIVINREV
jgi:hypothetical protein